MLVLESDAVPVAQKSGSWVGAIHRALQQLPGGDWDLLYLFTCYHDLGKEWGPGVRVMRAGVCVSSLLVRRRAALKAGDCPPRPRSFAKPIGRETPPPKSAAAVPRACTQILMALSGEEAYDIELDHLIRSGCLRAFATDPFLAAVRGSPPVMAGGRRTS